MIRFQRWAQGRRFFGRWAQREDDRPYYDASVAFQAADEDEADRLFEAMTDAIGCSEDCAEKPCPHFRVGGYHRMEET